ncbi:hypothetical protein Vadar_007542 [Vaccinium darrowii]|uniref:Uncharacterized protein n=1 Tax=Vaccinium darrowii TaxID=229202 RepID=A0ACB7YKZ8_9ERIC|nr:hypothetical protein Vadar_007542 [Vaccinium darrowii]
MERDEQKQPLISKGGVTNREEILNEVKKLLCLAGPIVSVNLLLCFLQMISVMFVGHLGELPLAGASMATSFASVTGFSLMIGMGSALDTFLFKSGLGNKGAALANGISYWTNAILLAVYVRVSPSCKKTWTGFSTEALHDVMKFVRLAVPSALMICLEIWSFEMMVLLAGLLPNPKLETSVLSICLNTCSVVYMIPLGLSGATSIRVSNELGAGRPQAARLAVCVVVCMVATEGVIVATVLILGHHVWGYSYSKEEKVVRYVGEMLILLAPSHFLDGLQSVLSGTARGCGWQKIGAFANLGAYYLIGIPVGITLAFVYHFGGKGLWTGIIVALFAQASFLAIITLRTDWEKEAKKASNRVYGSMIPVEACS